MIIDVHAHIDAPPHLYAVAQKLLNARGMEYRPPVGIDDELFEKTCLETIRLMDEVGTDVRFISPRPYLMHSERPAKVVQWWSETVNDYILRTVKAHPTRFQAVCALPQVAGEPVSVCFEELDRCVSNGFIGVMLNPDPGEGDNKTPTLDNEYWYPLYEKIQSLGMPALVHACSCAHHQRESYIDHMITEASISVVSLCRSTVFDDFPDLKLIISHGGGCVPYQVGRWRAMRQKPGRPERRNFDEALGQLYFDTCLYTQNALELLFKEVPPERCLFGTERFGVGTFREAARGGEYFDDIKAKIDRVSFLTADQRQGIYEGTARKIFTRWKPA